MTWRRHTHQNCWIRTILISIIMLCSIPTQLVLPLPFNSNFQDDDININTLSEITLKPVEVSKLMRKPEHFSEPTNELPLDTTPNAQENWSIPNYAIGSQSGIGGGSYDVRDSLNLTNVENLDLSDTAASPDSHDDEITITIPSGFTNNTGWFNITNIAPLYDWRHVEYDRVDGFTIDSNNGNLDTIEAAMEFNVSEEYANLTQVMAFTISHQSPSLEDPTGTIFIVNGTWVTDHWAPNPDDILSSQEDISLFANWRNYIFDSDVILRSDRHYFVVLNDTSTATGAWWEWGAQKDSGASNSDNDDEGEFYYKYQSHSAAWSQGVLATALDLNLIIKVKPVQKSGNYFINRIFSNPGELDIIYNTTTDERSLSSFNWFEWNGTSDNVHRFRTNTSVSFDLQWIVNLTNTDNPLATSLLYYIENNSLAIWNLTFSTSSITTSYNIRNRTITINGLENDWNGSAIYLDGSLEYNTNPSGGLNTSVTYSNQSSTMIINASTLATATDWNVSFDAPNYVLDFSISDGGIPLDFPYQTFTMNDYNLNFEVGAPGNLTYWIDYPNGSQILKKNFNDTHTIFNDLWDINTTFDNLSNVNGTYYLQAFWNNSDSSKVGTYTREVSMIVNSTFDYSYETEVVLDTNLNIIVYYNSTHNTTVVNGANVSGVPSWGSQSIISFNHTSAHDPYTFSLEINNSQHNPGDIISVEISAVLSGYVSNSTTINVKVVSDATLNTNISQDFVIEWRENKTIEIKYNETGGSGINEATIAVDGDSTNVYNISDVYYFRFNATDPKYGGVSIHLNLNISASHTNYLTKIWYFNLTITPGKTNITANIDGNGAISNNTPGTQIYYANSSADHVSILLRYYHNLTNYNLSSLATITIESTPFIPLLDSREGPDSTWNLTFNPAQNNIFTITITFNLTNYANAAFIFILEVLNARTEIETDFLNNTQVFYRESFDFSTFFNNTDWNENITFDGQGPFSISSPGKIQYLNRTGVFYWFRFAYNPLVVGISTHSVSITFTYANFDSSSLNVIFDVVKSPFVDIDGSDALTGSPLSNFTSTYTKHFSPNEYDNFSISLSYYANKTTEILTTTPSVSLNITIGYAQAEQLNHNWTFIFNGSALGTFLINITFSHENYTSLTFTVKYVIQPADSVIADLDIKIKSTPINATVKSGNILEFWVVWQSQYGENIGDNLVDSNNSALVFINSTIATGIHYFNFTAGTTGIITVNLTFETIYYSALNLTLRFQVTDRALAVDNDLSTHPHLDVFTKLQYRDIYYFYVFLNDSDDHSPIDVPGTGISPLGNTNITFVNVSSGMHLFNYTACHLGSTGGLTIQFTKANYASVIYTITFVISSADSDIFLAPSLITTNFTQDRTFWLIWESIPNPDPDVPTSPTLRINSTQINTSHLWVKYLGNPINGNHSFLIESDIVGNFTITLYFFSNTFVKDSPLEYSLIVTILTAPTKLGANTSPDNTTTINCNFSEILDIKVQWEDILNTGSDLECSSDNITLIGNGSIYTSFESSSADGTHDFTFQANELGTLEVIITLATNNLSELSYVVFFEVAVMPTNLLNITEISYNESILVEDVLYISGGGYRTIEGDHLPSIDSITLWMNGSQVSDVNLDIITNQDQFVINFTTEGYLWGPYNLTLQLWTYGYQNQSLNLSITLMGREITVTVTLPSKTMEQGQPIEITVTLDYAEGTGGGIGAGIALADLENIDVAFYIGLQYQNGSIEYLEAIKQTNPSGETSYTIDEKYTRSAIAFSNITVIASASLSGLPASYSMSESELAEYKITTYVDPLALIISVVTIGTILLLIVGSVVGSGIVLNRKRKRRSATIQTKRRKIEQSFEDIKSIRLLIARHESGLQFYSEKTIAELQTDTDALSGMSAALSSFMEEVSDGMRSRSEEQKEKDKIEVMSREGLHMLIWHGKCSSFIIISEVRLPDYFQDRLAKLGREVEARFAPDLQDFYRSDQIPSSQVKKMVRKHIPLHYFSAFILNEGVVTLESIKLSGKEKKMLNLIKEIRFQKEGVQFFFSEQIISHLSKHFNRSEAIKFLDRAIEINLLIEASQEDILSLSK